MVRKAALGVLAAIVLLVAAYAAAGYAYAPRWVRDTLQEQAARAGLQLQLDAVRVDPFGLRLSIDGLRARTESPARDVGGWRHASVDLAWSSLWRRTWTVEQVRIEGPRLAVAALPAGPDTAPRDAALPPFVVRELVVVDGALSLEPPLPSLSALRVELRDVSTVGAAGSWQASAALAGGQASAQGRVSHDAGRWLLSETKVSASNVAHAGIGLSRLEVDVPTLALPPAGTIDLSAKAAIVPSGTLSAQGRVGVRPLTAELQIEARSLALPQARRFLREDVGASIVSGTVSGDGRLRIDMRAGGVDASYTGSATVADLRIDERGSDRLLIAWQRLHANGLAITSQPPGVRVGELDARSPEARLAIGPQGDVNWVRAFGAGADAPGAAKSTAAESGKPGDDRTSKRRDVSTRGDPAKSGDTAHPGDAAKAGAKPGRGDDAGGSGTDAPLQYAIERLKLAGGTLHFSDRSLETPFEATVRELSGTIVGIGNVSDDAAQVELDGRVEPQGSARIRGRIDLDAPRSLADITADLRDLPLPAFSPYVAKFAGYRIRSGRASARLHYEVRDGQLQGRNDLVFEQIQLGEKLERRGIVDVPLDLAVALLSDSKGRIDLDIPVSGNLNDPQIDIGGLVAKAIGNVLGKIVTAPFRAIASLAGGGGRDGDLGRLHFDPGSARMTLAAAERVGQVAKALQQRPQLELTVRGGFDRDGDADALRERAVRREIARRAGIDAAKPLDLADPAVRQAAERLYLDRIGNRLELQSLRRDEAPYGEVLLDRLKRTVPDDAVDAEALGRERAEAVLAALVERGVAASRVRIEPAEPAAAGADGIPTSLALRADGGALRSSQRAAPREAGGRSEGDERALGVR